MAKCICTEKETLNKIQKDISSLLQVTILNGHDDHITYSRNEFFQMLYDRPKDFIKKQFSLVDHITKIIAVINLLLLVYMAISK